MESSSKQQDPVTQSSQWTKVDKSKLKSKLLQDLGLQDVPPPNEAVGGKPMENLSLQDLPPPGGPNHVQPPPGAAPQLPPQAHIYTKAGYTQVRNRMTDREAFVMDYIEKLVLVLRDGKKLIGVLRSWDQFANLVLLDTIERIFVKEVYADIPRGIYIVRGENVLLLGEIDLDKDDYIPEPFRKVSAEEVHTLMVGEQNKAKKKEKIRAKKLKHLGFDIEHSGEVLF